MSEALEEIREQTIAALSDHYANDRLDVDEFEKRVAAVHAASSEAEIRREVSALVPVGETAPANIPAPSTEIVANAPAERNFISVLGGNRQRGSWQLAERNNVFNLLGSTELDLREAKMPADAEIKVTAVLGGVDIIVPPGMTVDSDVAAILSEYDDQRVEVQHGGEDAPRVRITGFTLLAGITVDERYPGESKRDAKKRRKRERKQKKLNGRAAKS